MKKRFGDLAIGSRFCFRARRYEKVAAEIGRDEERGGNVFHPNTEVLAEVRSADCGVRSGRPKPKVVAPAPAKLGRDCKVLASKPWAVQDQDLRKKERARVPEEYRARAIAALEDLCPPYN